MWTQTTLRVYTPFDYFTEHCQFSDSLLATVQK